jgi:methyl-accepting chemotaxis protein
MRTFSKSAGLTLRILLGLMILVMVVGTAASVVSAWQNYVISNRIVRLVEADKILFATIDSVRLNRGRVQTALLSEADAPAKLLVLKEENQQRANNAFAAFLSTDIADKHAIVDKARGSWAKAVLLYESVLAEGAKPKGTRSLAVAGPWFDAISDFGMAINAGSNRLAGEVGMADSVAAEMQQFKAAGWTVRSNYGLQCSTLRPNIDRGAPLQASETLSLGALRGAVSSGLEDLRMLAARPNVSDRLARTIAATGEIVPSVTKQIDGLLAKLDGSGRPAIAPEDWTKLCSGPNSTILSVVYGALDETAEHAVTRQTAALINLGWQAVFLIGMVGLGALGTTVVHRRVTRPIAVLMAVVERLTARDFKTPVPRWPYPDEFGRLCSALDELRTTASEAEALAERNAQQSLELNRAADIDAACRSFDQSAATLSEGVAKSAGTVRATAEAMKALAADASRQVGRVSDDAEEARSNVATAESSAEQLTAETNHIGQQIQATAQAARNAMQQVSATNAGVQALDDAAQRIGEVVSLISDIASQTNLLALNATIEAARAGESGRGFSVVASEVKSLAGQTSRATEEIAKQVAAIQQATKTTVEAIRDISGLISGIDKRASGIDAAVHKQEFAAREMAGSVQVVADVIARVTQAISAVSKGSDETSQAADAAFATIDAMVQDTRNLNAEIRRFIGIVREIRPHEVSLAS